MGVFHKYRDFSSPVQALSTLKPSPKTQPPFLWLHFTKQEETFPLLSRLKPSPKARNPFLWLLFIKQKENFLSCPSPVQAKTTPQNPEPLFVTVFHKTETFPLLSTLKPPPKSRTPFLWLFFTHQEENFLSHRTHPSLDPGGEAIPASCTTNPLLSPGRPTSL